MTLPLLPYEQLVFSGGGTRCFWHGGWLSPVERHRRLAPARVVGVSGGSVAAAAWIAGVGRPLFEDFLRTFARQDSNLSWHDLDAEDGRTPHQRVYREILERVFGPEAQARIAEGPAFQVMLAHPAEGRLADLHALLAGSAYQLEKAIVSRPSSEWAPNLGLEGRLVDARAAAAQGRMVELLLRAATIPPIFRIEDWDGRPAVDGGMIDHVPQPEPDRGRTLVLVTRDYRRMPEAGERITYVTPSEWVLSGKIDFTDPDKLRRAWTLGQEDGRAFLAHTDIHGLQ